MLHQVTEISQDNNSLKKINSNKALVEFIIAQKITNESEFHWSLKLKEAGYEPVFESINLEVLYMELAKYLSNPNYNVKEFLAKTHIYDGMTFNKCTLNDSYLFKKAHLMNCNFNHCTIYYAFQFNPFSSVTFTDCKLLKKNDFSNTTLNDTAFINCTLVEAMFFNVQSNNLKLINCDVKNSKFVNVNGLSDSYEKNTLTADCVFSNTSWDKQHMDKFFNKQNPIVVTIYCPQHGTTNLENLIPILKNRGLNVIFVSPEIGMDHFIFKNNIKISGYILPGGYNLDSNSPDLKVQAINKARTLFESQIYNEALKTQTPILAICRGQQMVGRIVGGEICDSVKHTDKKSKIFVSPESQLHTLLEAKNDRRFTKNKFLLPKENGKFFYYATCLHGQAVFFKNINNNDDNNNNLIVSGMSEDNTVESLEFGVNGHGLAFQHHPESPDTSYGEASLVVGKAFLKIFCLRVKYFFNKNTVNAEEDLSITENLKSLNF